MISCPACGGGPPLLPGDGAAAPGSCACRLLSLIGKNLGGGLCRTVLVVRALGLGTVHVGDGTLRGEPEVRLFGPDGNVLGQPPGDLEAWVRDFGPWILASQVLGS